MTMTCTSLILGLHLVTAHFDTRIPHNDVNPGVYAVCDDWVAGNYRNSQWRNSAYVGRVWHAGRIDIVTGAITGYRAAKVLPFVAPSMKVGEHLRIALLPPVKLSGWGGLHASWEW